MDLPMSKLVLFDVNGTLLDIHALAPELKRLFGRDVSVREWFLEVLQYSLITNVLNSYRDFGELALAVLSMRASSRGVTIKPKDALAIKTKLTSLPPFRDVKPALTRLKQSGFRLATLTNSGRQSQEKQLQNAGLSDFFEQTFSVEIVHRFKPDAATYRTVADTLGVRMENMIMVAAHGWDIWGALDAGCQAAFVQRPEQALFPLGPQPSIVGPNLANVAEQIIYQGH
jgi:2-haloacid dehalogenase